MSRLAGWLLNTAYVVLLLAAAPLIVWSAWRHGKHREGFGAKFLGLAPRRIGDRPCIWLHAVSVGEVNLLATTLSALRSRESRHEVVISTTTKTGYDLARRKYADYSVFYCPLDFTWAVAAAMRRVRPSLLVLAELELWPNLVAAAQRHGAQVAIINARLSDHSFSGYRRVRPFVGRVLRRVELVAAQDADTADRFAQLGARRESVHVTGSLKFDGAQTERTNSRTRQLRQLAGITDSDIVLLAGSTQDPEERYAVDAWRKLSLRHPNLRLILVPRHPERFSDVANHLAASGVPWQRRSELPPLKLEALTGGRSMTDARAESGPAPSRWGVLLVDTIGELGAWWGTAAIGFVGGSFGSRGGQNMLEPAAYGVATCFGPNTWNFRDIVTKLLAAQGARVVQDAAEFEAFVRHALEHADQAHALGQRAHQLVCSQQGATNRTVDLLLQIADQRDSSSTARFRAA